MKDEEIKEVEAEEEVKVGEVEEEEIVNEVEEEEEVPLSDSALEVINAMLTESTSSLQGELDKINKRIKSIMASIPENKEPKSEEDKTFEDYFQ